MEEKDPSHEWNYSSSDTRPGLASNDLYIRPILYYNGAGTIIDPRLYMEEVFLAAERGEIRKLDPWLQEYRHRQQMKRGYQYRKRIREFKDSKEIP